MEKILKYLRNRKFFLHYWTEDQLKQAIVDLDIKLSDVSEEKGFEDEPKCLQVYEILRTGKVSVIAQATPHGFAGQSIAGYVSTLGFLCRVQAPYQTQTFAKLVKYLLEQSLPWAKHFKFSIYDSSISNDYEIYLNIPESKGLTNNSVYCPLSCLLNSNWQGIVDRHTSYATGYYRRDLQASNLKQAMQASNLKQALNLLKSDTALQLKACLEGNIPDFVKSVKDRRDDWKYQINNNDTELGYADWLVINN